jgi:hypothetical protein
MGDEDVKVAETLYESLTFFSGLRYNGSSSAPREMKCYEIGLELPTICTAST